MGCGWRRSPPRTIGAGWGRSSSSVARGGGSRSPGGGRGGGIGRGRRHRPGGGRAVAPRSDPSSGGHARRSVCGSVRRPMAPCADRGPGRDRARRHRRARVRRRRAAPRRREHRWPAPHRRGGPGRPRRRSRRGRSAASPSSTHDGFRGGGRTSLRGSRSGGARPRSGRRAGASPRARRRRRAAVPRVRRAADGVARARPGDDGHRRRSASTRRRRSVLDRCRARRPPRSFGGDPRAPPVRPRTGSEGGGPAGRVAIAGGPGGGGRRPRTRSLGRWRFGRSARHDAQDREQHDGEQHEHHGRQDGGIAMRWCAVRRGQGRHVLGDAGEVRGAGQVDPLRAPRGVAAVDRQDGDEGEHQQEPLRPGAAGRAPHGGHVVARTAGSGVRTVHLRPAATGAWTSTGSGSPAGIARRNR